MNKSGENLIKSGEIQKNPENRIYAEFRGQIFQKILIIPEDRSELEIVSLEFNFFFKIKKKIIDKCLLVKLKTGDMVFAQSSHYFCLLQFPSLFEMSHLDLEGSFLFCWFDTPLLLVPLKPAVNHAFGKSQ